MFTKRTENATLKAFQTFLSNEASKGNVDARYEHNLSCYTAKDSWDRPNRHNFTQEEIMERFSRSHGGSCGATKRTHCLEYIVVKRYKWNGYEFWGEGCGNQLIDEINCWNRLASTPDSDFLCPILKYFTCKSDKVTPLADKMKEKVVIIAIKAVFVSDMAEACKEAERLNRLNGYRGERASYREQAMREMAHRMGWRDVEWNRGNSGVIFDHAKNCYKAVFIDYAL